MIATILRLLWLRLLEIEADGFALAGNRRAALDAAARIALLRAQLRPLGTPVEPAEDDDEAGEDDDLKAAA